MLTSWLRGKRSESNCSYGTAGPFKTMLPSSIPSRNMLASRNAFHATAGLSWPIIVATFMAIPPCWRLAIVIGPDCNRMVRSGLSRIHGCDSTARPLRAGFTPMAFHRRTGVKISRMLPTGSFAPLR